MLRVVDEILRVSHDTAIAPQVILRQARVMKDSGDLHTALRVFDAVISRGSFGDSNISFFMLLGVWSRR